MVARTIRSLAFIAILLAQASAADKPPEVLAGESEVLFVRRIAPMFREKCLGCHGQDPEAIEGGIDFRAIAPLMAGGDSGAAGISPGKPEASAIYLAAAREEETFSAMPPKESEALSDEQLRWLGRWIETGARWPSDERALAIEAEYADTWSAEDGVKVKTSGGLDTNWTNRRYDPAGLWAYQPVAAPVWRDNNEEAFPTAKGDQVDHFIDLAMPDGIAVAPRADRRTLIRRATFDLTGLPPTLDEIACFLSDPADDKTAFRSLVDRLLASPHYGERMAQHWLDVTRYADSSGFANDYQRGNAWRYRDYVIRSFNEDKPYDQFIRQQIAGDEIEPDDPESVVAVGFLRMGPWELTGMEVAKVARMRFLDDVTNSVGETFLGQSLQCCRCHDHKFDPIPTRDYYSIQAVFATTQLAERATTFLETENLSGFEEKTYLDQQHKQYTRTQQMLDDLLLENAEKWYDDIVPFRTANDRTDDQPTVAEQKATMKQRWNDSVAKVKQNRSGRGVFAAARNSLLSAGVDPQEIPPVRVGFTPQQFGLERVSRKGMQRLQWEFDRYQPFAHSVYNGHTPSMTSVSQPLRIPKDRTHGELEKSVIHTGGDPFSEGEPVAAGVLSVIEDQVPAAIPQTIDGRRTALADWIADSKNPLTTRVIANRIWQWHFGRAIAGNPNNFGSTGKRPTHPELLDWLAGELVAGGWSIKNLHRRIMNSDTYCRSTQYTPATQASGTQGAPTLDRDALARASNAYAVYLPRRLSAEELRDSMLRVSGELNPAVGGIPCRPIINAEVALQPRQVMGTFAAAWTPNPKPHQRNRRSIYVLKLRGLVTPELEVFNAPSPDFSCERRDTSTVTPQVFAMFNSRNTHARARALASDTLQSTSSPTEAIRVIYQRLFGRKATADEIERSVKHWQRIESMLPGTAEPVEPPAHEIVREAVEENTGERFRFTETRHAIDDFQPDIEPSEMAPKTRALADVCLVLMNSNEFVYVY
ncbi:Planctomycete cytochrome C [Rosistilla carotiformis]|uniref:Planctomycete cytochrome C n=1 Tax=Rosistilla carotiformis TaxID=2528017 RepID=A0A518JQR5_9BACT|nr:PSD1 and planctomycete cytochrome C domain-containing protein [Rosistilla carotiformis]QDV67885.1 Planctomycete cytochrome C [Rosistilla carotiformis]